MLHGPGSLDGQRCGVALRRGEPALLSARFPTAMSEGARKVILGDRLRYGFDNTMSRGPIALIGWLGLLI